MEKILNSKIVFDCPVFKVEEMVVELPDKSTAKRWFVVKNDAVFAICVLDTKILLLKEYRSASQSWEWWVPAGGVEHNETPEHAAVREIREETGLEPKTIKLLATFDNPSSILKHKTHVFIASEFRTNPLHSGEVEDYYSTIKYFSFGEVNELINKGEIRDSTILGGLRVVLSK